VQSVTFQGEAFSEYFCTKLLPSDPRLAPLLDGTGALESYKRAAALIRRAQRLLRDREQPRSTYALMLVPLAELLGWQIGEASKVATDLDQEEEGGVPLIDSDGAVLARAVSIGPDAHLDAAPSGLNRLFAPTLSLARVLREESLSYGLLLNAFELRLLYSAGTLPSHIGFDLTAVAEGTDAGLVAWKLIYGLLRQEALSSRPPLLDSLREVGKKHQQRVSTTLGHQVQQAAVRFMQGLLDHPENAGKIPSPLTPDYQLTLYQQTLRLLYRLLFILYAEDLNLLPIEMRTYREGYSLSRLTRFTSGSGPSALVVADPNGTFVESSLQALFALLKKGVNLGAEGEIRPYGGGLFGSSGTDQIDNLKWGNETLVKVIEFLTWVPAPKGHVGKARLSYRELNVEQLGSIYEGLLEQVPAFSYEWMWRAELDARIIFVTRADRERISRVRREEVVGEVDLDEPESSETLGADDNESDVVDDSAEIEDEERPGPPKSPKKPLRILEGIPPGKIFLKAGSGRKESGSFYTNQIFVDFLVREALDPLADGRPANEILSLKVLDPAMGSGHFLVGACRRLAEHLLAAYRREVATLKALPENSEFAEDDLLVMAGVPNELIQVWNSSDQERELAACRLLVAGHCIYGVDKNPLAVDLAKVSLWLVTAASRLPLTFLDHRLRCGDSLLGIPAEEVIRPWVLASTTSSKASAPRTIRPVEFVISPRHGQETFDFYAPSQDVLCQAFARALVRLRELINSVESDPTDFELHSAKHAALRGTLEPWWEMHELRVGIPFEESCASQTLINSWLEDLLTHQRVTEEHRREGVAFVRRGREVGAFCWELAFPEVFYEMDGKRREGAGFSCVLGNPPWDKIKAERDSFYLQFDPLIRQLQGTERSRRIDVLHQENPDIESQWRHHEFKQSALAETLITAGIYFHQLAVIEDQTDGEKGEPIIRRKTTGADPDCFRFFLERAWQLVAKGKAVGMVMSSGLHLGQGSTGLRRLLLDECDLKVLVKFDNEMGVFPGVHNQFKFDLVVFNKGGRTARTDAAFFSRENTAALLDFRNHRCFVRLEADYIHRLSPQTLTIFEFRGQGDFDLVRTAYRLHKPFSEGLMRELGLKYRTEFHMGNMAFLFRSRDWLRRHGCSQEPGEQWRAAQSEWYYSRGYFQRPIAEWYVFYEGDRVKAHRLPWAVKSRKNIRETDLKDFDLRIDLGNDFRFIAKTLTDGEPNVFVPPEEALASDLPAYVPGLRGIGPFSIAPALRPLDVFLPLMEGKWIYQMDHQSMAYVTGSGSWVVTRQLGLGEKQTVPQYFLGSLDARTRSSPGELKVGFRDVTSASNERSFVAAIVPSEYPCGHQLPVLAAANMSTRDSANIVAWANSVVTDFFIRLISGGHATLSVISQLPAPIEFPRQVEELCSVHSDTQSCDLRRRAIIRAQLDAIIAELFELTPLHYAYLLSSFPLLDRDQPPLPHDYRIRRTKKGLEQRPISFITRDLALLTYFDYLSGNLAVKPDRDRALRICPDGVGEAPADIVSFYFDAGVDIDGTSDFAVAATGPYKDLRERVGVASELGAVAYLPTIDRRRATFVEAAAAAGGLSPDEGVLTPEMSELVIREKEERESRWRSAMELWKTYTSQDVVRRPVGIEGAVEASSDLRNPTSSSYQD
jgi:Eco57I restriction-modification methylase